MPDHRAYKPPGGLVMDIAVEQSARKQGDWEEWLGEQKELPGHEQID